MILYSLYFIFQNFLFSFKHSPYHKIFWKYLRNDKDNIIFVIVCLKITFHFKFFLFIWKDSIYSKISWKFYQNGSTIIDYLYLFSKSFLDDINKMTLCLSHSILNFPSKIFSFHLNTLYTYIKFHENISFIKWIKDGLLLFKVVSGGLWLSSARGWSVPLCITVSTAISISRSRNYASLWNSVERHSWVISMLISR